ncbi:sigma-70 family RNA polymerase sigma factor [Dactylosporangium sp. NPDC048998]|uniref:sigma-70 family RNA polymerase sigma factor n=1 Tax=Dactylosporangium sp. NPDC048998 TaxID=3363976 RepID=UPI00371D5464
MSGYQYVFETGHALAGGLSMRRDSMRDMYSTVIRGEGGSVPRTRWRPHTNEAPARPAPNSRPNAGMNGKPTGGAGASLRGEETVPIPTGILGGGTDTLTETGPREPVPPQPTRPERGDPAAEVWALIERAQAGDGAAFGLLYDRYFDTVFRFVYFRVGNRQLAEDLTADTFLRALKRIGSFTWQGRDLGAWLVTIARNLVADHFKSGRYRLEVTTGDVLDADRPDRGPEGSPEAAVIDHITNVDLLKAVKQLNPEQQECIVLRFLHGFSVAETAQTMNKNEGAIKALQYRAVRALARLLPDGFQP